MASIRDLTCIRSVSHMAEYGKYEEEFIVYGCSCMEKGKIVYRISPQYQEIAQFVEASRRKRQYPSPVHTLMRRCVVQTGQREQLLYETELELAGVLQKTYSRVFFEQLEQCGNAEAFNAAKVIFDELRFQLNGIFSSDYLQLFEGLVSVAWQAHLLTEDALVEIEQWLHKVKMQMAYDIVAKKPFVRTFYGICYVDAKGKYQYKVNAQEDIVLEEQRKAKRQNLKVSPIFHKTYWYDYGVEPKMIREQFKKEVQ
ncbi:MAG: hypothetical protein J6J59_01155, partial [Peptococcaceae bacterium]|nr:hypothetical protein [Peptococcaceae bacterium]